MSVFAVTATNKLRSGSARAPYLRRAGAAFTALAVVASVWWLAAPASLGGGSTAVTVNGMSMKPHYRPGDLVVLRAASRYRVGEIVGYRSRLLGRQVVLHRIVAIKGDVYVIKGDGNDHSDPEAVHATQLVGREAFHLPRAGRILDSLRQPWLLALLAGGTVTLLALPTPRRSRDREHDRG